MAHLHEELSSSTERLQAELAEWQGRCEALEGHLQAQQAHSSQLEQDLKTRPTPQQVTTILFSCCNLAKRAIQSRYRRGNKLQKGS